ncbi:MAG: ATP-binding cassette domain-containing protein [Caulobacteraceae bacterium]
MALLGPSGSGKTTLLRTIAGLEFPEQGQVLFDGQDVTFAGAAERKVGFVFQQYALFKHMTVARNVAFGLDVRKRKDRPDKAVVAKRVQDLLELVELGEMGKRFPSQLRRRPAPARRPGPRPGARPSVLLLDERAQVAAPRAAPHPRRHRRHHHLRHPRPGRGPGAGRPRGHPQPRPDRAGGRSRRGVRAPGQRLRRRIRRRGSQVRGRGHGRPVPRRPAHGPANGQASGAAQAFVRPHQFALASANDGFEVKVDRIVAHGAVLRLEATIEGGRRLDAAFPRDLAAELSGRERLRLQVEAAHVFPA